MNVAEHDQPTLPQELRPAKISTGSAGQGRNEIDIAAESPLLRLSVDSPSATVASWRKHARERVSAKTIVPDVVEATHRLAGCVRDDGDTGQESVPAERSKLLTAVGVGSNPVPPPRLSWRNASAPQVHVPTIVESALRRVEPVAIPPVIDSSGPISMSVAHPVNLSEANPPPSVDLSKASAPPVDLNKLHSAAMRAQLMGDTEKHSRLLEQIAVLTAVLPPPRPATISQPNGPSHEESAAVSAGHKRSRGGSDVKNAADSSASDVEVRLVSALDASGRPIRSLTGQAPQIQRADLRNGRRAGKLTGHANLHSTDDPTARQSWTRFDASERSLADIVRAEADATSGSLDSTIALHIARAGAGWKNKAMQGSRAGFDEDDDGGTDDIARLAEHPDDRLTEHARHKKDLQRAAASDRRHDAATAACPLCFNSAAAKKHLIIALGEHAYLALPPGCGRLPGQLRIVPVPHVAAITEADEEVRFVFLLPTFSGAFALGGLK